MSHKTFANRSNAGPSKTKQEKAQHLLLIIRLTCPPYQHSLPVTHWEVCNYHSRSRRLFTPLRCADELETNDSSPENQARHSDSQSHTCMRARGLLWVLHSNTRHRGGGFVSETRLAWRRRRRQQHADSPCQPSAGTAAPCSASTPPCFCRRSEMLINQFPPVSCGRLIRSPWQL